MSTAPQPPSDAARLRDERVHEVAMGEVSDVLLNLEHALTRAKKALAKVRKDGGEQNVELALVAVITDLGRTRKRLMQETYYAGEAVRLV
jgi:hypothetical protein